MDELSERRLTPDLVFRLRQARSQSKRLIRDAKEAGAAASELCDEARALGAEAVARVERPASFLDDPDRFVVAVEVLPERGVVAHLLRNIGRQTAALSMTLCGEPAECLAVLTDQQWLEVDEDRRCGPCGQSTGSPRSTGASTADPA